MHSSPAGATSADRAARIRRAAAAITAAALSILLLGTTLLSSLPAVAMSVPAGVITPVGMGAAGSYSVLAATVASTGDTVIGGDLGADSADGIGGFPPGIVNGTIRTGDEAAQAQADVQTAYADAGARTPTASLTDNDAQTYGPGVYHTSEAFGLSGTMTLDAADDPNAVFIFQVSAALNTDAASEVRLINGAQPARVFWQVGGAAGTGERSSFAGTILAAGPITIGEAGSLTGRALSQGTVTLAGSTVTTATDPAVTITGGASDSTNDITPTISGSTNAVAGSPVSVTVAGQTLTTTAQGDGVWTVAAATLTEGPHTVAASVSTLSATNPAGNTGLATQTLTIDTVAPALSITGGAATTTNKPTPTIAGSTDAAAKTEVTVSVAGQILSAPVTADGTWSVTAAKLPDGRYPVTASVTDAAGNTGTAAQTLTLDTVVPPVRLGAAESYSVLAATNVTSTGTTTISGDLGVSPGTAVVGFPPGIVNGAIRTGEQAAQTQTDLLIALSDAATREPSGSFDRDNNGRTFLPGVHHTDAAFGLRGTLTLDAAGDPQAVFIFQVNGALTTEAASRIDLVGGASAANVFWRVNGAAGLAANSSFTGTILATGSITIGEGATLTGRALSRDAVTLAGNTITTPLDAPGSLSITAPADGGSLGSGSPGVAGVTISGSLGQVQVVDTRQAAADLGWVASVASTAFIAAPGQLIPAGAVSYTTGAVTATGPATLTANDPRRLDGVFPALTATGVSGANTAAWNPLITVTIPGSAIAGIYSATITHSVL